MVIQYNRDIGNWTNYNVFRVYRLAESSIFVNKLPIRPKFVLTVKCEPILDTTFEKVDCQYITPLIVNINTDAV